MKSRRRKCAITVAAAALAAFLAPGTSAASADPALHYCIAKSVALGVVSDLEHVSVRTACDVVRKFVAWSDEGRHKVVDCPSGNFVGTGTLVIHTFDGYRLSIKESLVMSRGPSSFRVSGYDGWPVGCD
jgi:hypothetical protein